MRECANVNVFINEDGTPVIQFVASELFNQMSPVDKAVIAESARKICGILIDDIISQHPGDAKLIRERCESVSLSTGFKKGTLN